MFEHSLIALDAKKQPRRSWLSLPVAIVLHLVVLAAFTFAGYWHTNEVPEPMVNLVFYDPAPPPPPPPVLGSGQPETKRTVEPPEPQPVKPEQPTVDPDPTPAATSPVVEGIADLPPGGDPRGSIHGVDHGDPDFGVDHSDGPGGPGIQPEGAAPAPEPDRPIVVGGPVLKPEILFRTEPKYTEVARRAGVEGMVVLQAVIDERGNVTELKVLRSLPMGLDQAALDAVRTWRFKPATLAGRAVKVYFNLTVNFKIQR